MAHFQITDAFDEACRIIGRLTVENALLARTEPVAQPPAEQKPAEQKPNAV